MITPLSIKLTGDAERVRQSTADAIREMQAAPGVGLLVVRDVVLVDGVRTPVAHRLGRAPSWVQASLVRGGIVPGGIFEFRDGVDLAQRVEITASGWGATVTIDLLVVP